MGRLIVSKNAFSIHPKNQFAEEQISNQYLNRVVKYIPVEAIAIYMLMLGFTSAIGGNTYQWLSLLVFTVCAIGNPIWLCRFAKPGEGIMTHITVSFIAFIVWTYALGGDNGWFGSAAMNVYHPAIAGFALFLFTFVSGFIVSKS